MAAIKKSYELAEMFLKGRNSCRLSQKQYDWLNNLLIKERGNAWKFNCLFWNQDNRIQYRINGDGSLYNVTKTEAVKHG
jgi:hypothetical protein